MLPKAKFGTIHLIICGFLCTPFLAYGAATVFVMVAAGVPLAVAGLVFPAGYHAELPRPGDGDRQLRGDAHRHVRRNDHAVGVGFELAWILTGNLLGGIFFAWLLWFSWTYGGPSRPLFQARGTCSSSSPRPPSTRSSI